MGSDQVPAEAIVRIHDAAGAVVGTGFLATGKLVLTCAHVLGAQRPDGDVEVDFPLLAGDTRVSAQVVAWHGVETDDGGDIAVLRLNEVPSTAVASRLSNAMTRLVPAVRRNGMDVAVFRLLADEAALTSLTRALLTVLEPELGEQARLTEAESLAARLSTARATTVPWLADRLLSRSGPGGLLVFVDQFEESNADRELFEFLLALVGAARRHRDGSPALVVVVTLRSAALDDLVTDQTADQVANGVVFVPPMTREQLAKAVRPDGVDLEPGLAGRILDDAGTEPGTLPLVEFALARLWDKRSAGTLTHNAYDELGGVSGALAGYAARLYERLNPAEQEAARRLLVMMARPDDDGGFLRQPLRLSDLAEELLPVLAKLSTGRLVVVGKTGDDTEIVELTHQALLQRWPRLNDWLAERRDFLAWREQLRAGMARWQTDNRDQDGLLQGAALARAKEWLAGDTADLSAGEREYVRASQAREKRRQRVLRSVITIISVLALVAGGLAIWAATANQEAREQLRLAHSRALAEDSIRFRGIDPRMSLQLAQAAWHTAPTSEAYGALFTQYAGLQPVGKVFQDLWPGNVTRIMTGADGSRAVIARDDGWASDWLGLTGDNPSLFEHGALPRSFTGGTFQLSPSGRLLAYDNGDGTVAFWDRDHPGTVMLRDTTQTTRVVRSLAFSADETQLLIKRTGYGVGNPEYELWDLVRRTTVPSAQRLGPQDVNTDRAFLGPTPNTVVIGMLDGAAEVYDLTTGRLLRSIPKHNARSGLVARNGSALVQCDSIVGDREFIKVIDLATGAEQRNIPVPSCYNFALDTSTNYVLVAQHSPRNTDSNGQLTIIDLRTGESYELTTPPVELRSEFLSTEDYSDKIAVFPGLDGHPVVLIGHKNLLYRQRPAPLDQRESSAGTSQVVDPHGHFGVTFDVSGAIKLNDLRSKTTVATAAGDHLCWAFCAPGRPLDFSPDGKRLLAVRDNTLVIYSVPDLTVAARIQLPLPAELGGPPTEDGDQFHQWGSSVGILTDDQATILHAGVITRWNPVDGKQIGTPTKVRTERDALRRSAHKAALEPRPEHPAEAVVVQPSGDVELWNLDEHRITANLGHATHSQQGAVRFTPDGSVAAVRTPDGNIQLWDVGPARKRGRPVPTEGTMLGFAPDNKLIILKLDDGPGKAQIWDQDTGKQLASLTWPTLTASWRLADHRLTMFGQNQTHSMELNPDLWFDTLCQRSNRDFTDDERIVLAQVGAPDERPCG